MGRRALKGLPGRGRMKEAVALLTLGKAKERMMEGRARRAGEAELLSGSGENGVLDDGKGGEMRRQTFGRGMLQMSLPQKRREVNDEKFSSFPRHCDAFVSEVQSKRQ